MANTDRNDGNVFHDQQVNYLSHLVKLDATLYFPFFANTFPIAYHYFKALKPSNNIERNLRLRLHNWGIDDPTDQRNDHISVFYGTISACDAIQRRLESQGNGSFRWLNSPFSTYIPRFIFIKYSVYIREKLESMGLVSGTFKEPVLNRRFSEDILRDYDDVELFSDTPKQAEYIAKAFLENQLGFPPIKTVHSTNLNAIDIPEPERNILKIYFYGAPLSMFLRKRKKDYISFEIPENNLDLPHYFETYIYTVANSNNITVEELKYIHDGLILYHQNMFDAARIRKNFDKICDSYNRFAVSLQNKAVFLDANEYAKCVCMHHKFDDFGTIEKIGNNNKEQSLSISDNYDIPQKLHIHFGAGRIGIGLLLPLLNKSVRKVIFQRASDEWNKIAKKDMITLITSDNNLHINFRFVYDGNGDRLMNPDILSEDTIICYKNIERYREVIQSADSLSVSLNEGQENIKNYLSEVRFNKSVPLYIFENVNRMQGLENDIRIIPCVIDKVCSKRIIDAKNSKITILCEPYAKVVIKGQLDEVYSIFKKCEQLVVVDRDDEYEFHRKLKRYLVNGLYDVLAVFGYDILRQMNIHKKEWKKQYLTVLLHIILSESGNQIDFIDIYHKLQVIRIICETNIELFANNYETVDLNIIYDKLIIYCNDIKRRLLSNPYPDQLKRVFDLGKQTKASEKLQAFKELGRFFDEKRDYIKIMPIAEKPHIKDIYTTKDHINELFTKAFF